MILPLRPRFFHLATAAIVLVCFLSLAAAPQTAPPAARVGVGGAPVSLPLRDAILLALRRNTDLQVSRALVEEAEMNLTARRGAFDPRLGGSLSLLSDTVQVGSILAGGGRGVLSTDVLEGSLTLDQHLPFGGTWSLLFDSRRSTTSNVFNQLDPQFPSQLGVSFDFPLWRDRAVDSRRLDIKVADKSLQRSQNELRRVVLDVVTEVRRAYWDLLRARQNALVDLEAIGLANQQLDLTRRLLEAGQIAEVEILEAEATLERRRGDYLAAEEQITRQENALKGLVLGDRAEELWNRELLPVDTVEPGPQDADLSEAWTTAVSLRPELESLRLSREAQELNSDYLANQTKPAVDLFASYRTNGLAGAERTGQNPFSSQNDDVRARVNQLSELQGLPPLPPPSAGGLPEILLGGYGQSLSNLFSNDYRTAAVGVRVDLPLFNREARARLGASRAREKQIGAAQAALEQGVEAEIRDSLQAVQTARQRVEAAKAARSASQAKLESENRLFLAGETSNFLVLTRQNDYLENKAREVQAQIELNLAVAQFQRAVGNALESFQIALD